MVVPSEVSGTSLQRIMEPLSMKEMRHFGNVEIQPAGAPIPAGNKNEPSHREAKCVLLRHTL